jgi:hypothetical protein
MEPLVCRLHPGRVLLEAIFGGLLMAVFVLGFLPAIAPRDLDPRHAALIGSAVAALWLALLWWGRWRRRLVIDERGVELRRSKHQAIRRLDWGEVEEIFLRGWAGFELRGAGKSICLNGPYRFLDRARDRCAPRLTGIRNHLRTRALAEGKVVFRMPDETWKAHLAYLGAILLLTVLTGLTLAPLFNGRFFGWPIFLVFFGGSWFWGLRKRASGLGTRVTLQREGFVVRRLDGKERVAWSEFDHSEWNVKGGLDLVLKSRRVLPLPPSLGNIAMLEEFLREGPPVADSSSPGQAENRTMLQNP